MSQRLKSTFLICCIFMVTFVYGQGQSGAAEPWMGQGGVGGQGGGGGQWGSGLGQGGVGGQRGSGFGQGGGGGQWGSGFGQGGRGGQWKGQGSKGGNFTARIEELISKIKDKFTRFCEEAKGAGGDFSTEFNKKIRLDAEEMKNKFNKTRGGASRQFAVAPHQFAGAPRQHGGTPHQQAGAPFQYAGATPQQAGAFFQNAGATQQHAGTTFQHSGATSQRSQGNRGNLHGNGEQKKNKKCFRDAMKEGNFASGSAAPDDCKSFVDVKWAELEEQCRKSADEEGRGRSDDQVNQQKPTMDASYD